MINTANAYQKAYLKTEGNLNYRDCEIRYYTYCMFETPNKFKINVNVFLHYTQNNYIKTLSLDEYFDKDDAAIKYGIDQGKKFIDHSYELGKISIIKPELGTKAKNDKSSKVDKPTKNERSKADKK